jgi:hypothetical protein
MGDSSVAGDGRFGPYTETLLGKINFLIPKSVRLSDGFHHAGGAGHIDLPHTLGVEHAGAHRIDHTGQVHYRDRPLIAEQFVERSSARLVPKIHALELQRQVGLRRTHVHPKHREIGQQREQP